MLTASLQTEVLPITPECELQKKIANEVIRKRAEVNKN